MLSAILRCSHRKRERAIKVQRGTIYRPFIEEEAGEEVATEKQLINRPQFPSDLVGANEENQMYRCPSYVRQPRSVELRNDQQAVYQRV